jgi:hypothetical protein
MEVHQVADSERQVMGPQANHSPKTQQGYDSDVKVSDREDSQKAPKVKVLQRDSSSTAVFSHENCRYQKTGEDKEDDQTDRC